MGHPVNGIEYVLSNWERLRGQFPHYVFFLFTEEQRPFAEFFREHFFELDQISGSGCMFFAIAPPPPGWEDVARQREYWQHYLADPQANIGYDQDAVYQAARYFGVPREHLPAAVIFQEIHHEDALIVRLGDMQSEEWPGFFVNLFKIFNLVSQRELQDLYLRGLKKLINHLPAQRQTREWLTGFARASISPRSPQFERRQGTSYYMRQALPQRMAASRIEYPEQIHDVLTGLLAEMGRLSSEMAAMRAEQREGFREVNLRLERIQVVLEETVQRIEAFRGPFVVQWVALEDTMGSPDELAAAKQELHARFDNFLLQQSHYLAQRLDMTPVRLPPALQPLDNLLEPESRSNLLSAELLWENLGSAQLPWLDYSVCGIGLWKALEIELNRTFVDALRVSNRICNPGTFSLNQPYTPGERMTEPGRNTNGGVDNIHTNKSREIRDAQGNVVQINLENIMLNDFSKLIYDCSIN